MYTGEIRADNKGKIKPFGYGKQIENFKDPKKKNHIMMDGFHFDDGVFGKLILWLIS